MSTANPFVLRGAQVVFVDINPKTMNIDETKIEAAITSKTRAIVPVHYAGVACEMGDIMSIADEYDLYVVEDAAQAMTSTYREKQLGSIGHLGAFSFHETKNFTSGGEGGLLAVNDEQFVDRAEILREKGTNRSQFFRGTVDKYTWVDMGSSYLPSEIQAAYLWGQIEKLQDISLNRRAAWMRYHDELEFLSLRGRVEIPSRSVCSGFNAHIFYLKTAGFEERARFISHMSDRGVMVVFHYIPLHNSPAGKRYGRFSGEDTHTTRESERIVRLPLYYGMKESDQSRVIDAIIEFYD